MSIKVDNILLIEGTKESVAEAAKLILFRSPVHPEHWAFDFNRILPLPENITSDLAKQRIEAWGSSFSPYPTETFVTQREGFIEICFLTGLAPPFGIYRKLAEIFANLDVCLQRNTSTSTEVSADATNTVTACFTTVFARWPTSVNSVSPNSIFGTKACPIDLKATGIW
ncbi:hypothetical protein [Neisseria gonorrhoeae]